MSASTPHVSEPTSLAARDLIFLIIINLIWGLNLIASKIGVAQFPPVFFTALRFVLLTVLLFRILRIHPGQMKNLLLGAIFTGPAAFALLMMGLQLTKDASTVAIATQMSVPFSTLLSIWLLGDRIRWKRTLGIVLAFAGIVIIGFDPRVASYWQGFALVVISCLISSYGLICIKRLTNIKPLELQAWIGVTGAPTLLLLSFFIESGQASAITDATLLAWSCLLFTALFSSMIAHTGWYYLISRYPVTSLSPVTLLSPIFGVFFGVTLLNDQLTTRMLLGGAVTLIGVFIVVMREKRIADTGT
ncbi:MAG TPA: DMT family transporter [Steroidobacteraceae bacterium]|nr:DMT family transporter [Steroidobacteraceae bacterium]